MKRSEIKPKYKWNLNLALDNKPLEYWVDSFKNNIDKIAELKGKICSNIGNFRNFIKYGDAASIAGGRVGSYLNNKANEDNANQEATKNLLKITQVFSFYEQKITFVENEIFEGKLQIEKYLKEKDLESKKFSFEKVFRYLPHKLSDAENELLSKLSLSLGASESIFSKLNDADLDFGIIQDADGKKVHLTQGNYGKYLKDKKRSVRKNTFLNFGREYLKHKNTLAMTYFNHVSTTTSLCQINKYENSLKASLFSDNVPIRLYETLIKTTKNNVFLVKKWKKIIAKALNINVATSQPWDWSAPVSDASDKNYTIEDGIEIIKTALKPLGEKYAEKLNYLLNSNWIDYYPTDNKTSGAYSSSQWKCPAFILMNWKGKLRDVSTLAHEIGHSIHSMFSDEKQTIDYHSYPIFLAEVASTTNEYLLCRHLLKITKEPETRKAILDNTISDFIATVFRQVQFAEFEKICHETVEKDNPLTSEILVDLALKLNKEYYPRLKNEKNTEKYSGLWSMFVPHFYMDFYVYKYATGLISAYSLGADILNNKKDAISKYINFLSSGSSKWPITTLQDAGVNLLTPQPYENAFQVLENLLNEFSSVVDEKEIGE